MSSRRVRTTVRNGPAGAAAPPPGPTPSRAGSPLARAAIGVGVALALLAITEGVLRVVLSEVAEATIPNDVIAKHVEGGMRYDPDFGWAWSQVPVPSLGINSDGFRYAELPKEKPAGTLRGFTLGDSQTFGAGLEPDASYTAVAEAVLRAKGRDVQLVGAATAGYGSLQAFRVIQKKLLAWDPDFLVIDCRTFDQPRETRTPIHRGALEPVRALLFQSRIYYLLRLALREAGVEEGRRMNPHEGEPGMTSGEGNHELILEFATREGIQVVFVDYPLWSPGGILSRAPKEELPAGATVVPATAALLATKKPPDELFFDNNHLNVEGARIVGETLAATLDGVLRWSR